MRILLLALVILITVACKKHDTFYGYVVAKEKIPAHMDDETVQSVDYCVYIPIAAPRHIPEPVKEEWRIYMANKIELVYACVDSIEFTKYKCGDKIAFKR